MPDKPRWFDRLDEVIATLEASPQAWVDRRMLEELFGIGRRRAQQILSALAAKRSGASAILDRAELVNHLRRLATGEAVYYERRRKHRLWAELESERRQWIDTPPAFVEAPAALVDSILKEDFEGLPEGVELRPGQITVRFANPDEALQKLLALAMAVGQNRERFDDLVAPQTRT
ncbi:MAG: hypothetical protein JOZ62_11420 [Acidobacteriaceae bacterium]|nr:hypothetical protein [Acidobacteriaceae bacterium]